MRLALWVAFGLPGLTGLGYRLVRAGLILAPEWDAQRFGDVIGQVDQPLFFLGVRVDDGHHARLTLALGRAGRTPAACPLIRTASILQHPPNRAGANLCQARSP